VSLPDEGFSRNVSLTDEGFSRKVSCTLIKISTFYSQYGNIIVLINGCFHNGPVICPRLVIMAKGRLYWPEVTPSADTTFRGSL
jgi:hypothetical protein